MPFTRKRYFLTTASFAVLAGAASTASAQPVSWTGAYIGIHGGAIRQQAITHDLDRFADFFVGPGPFNVTQSQTGGIAGGHIGYNWQSRRLVYGIEVDGAGAIGADARVAYLDPDPGFPAKHAYATDFNWLATVRGRVGLEVEGTLAYVTGGLAIAGLRNRWGQGMADGTPPAFAYQFEDNAVRVGWTAGGGIEHRFAGNWSARVEGLYVDFGTSKTQSKVFTSPGLTDTFSFGTRWENTAIVGRAGVSYHFYGN